MAAAAFLSSRRALAVLSGQPVILIFKQPKSTLPCSFPGHSKYLIAVSLMHFFFGDLKWQHYYCSNPPHPPLGQ